MNLNHATLTTMTWYVKELSSLKRQKAADVFFLTAILTPSNDLPPSCVYTLLFFCSVSQIVMKEKKTVLANDHKRPYLSMLHLQTASNRRF